MLLVFREIISWYCEVRAGVVRAIQRNDLQTNILLPRTARFLLFQRRRRPGQNPQLYNSATVRYKPYLST